jgi:hypothetical protein
VPRLPQLPIDRPAQASQQFPGAEPSEIGMAQRAALARESGPELVSELPGRGFGTTRDGTCHGISSDADA